MQAGLGPAGVLVVDGGIENQICRLARGDGAIIIDGIGPFGQQDTAGTRLVVTVGRFQIAHIEAIDIAAVGVAQTEVAITTIERCNRLGFPSRGAIFLGVYAQASEIIFTAFDIDGHVLGRSLVAKERMFTSDGAVDVLNLLAVNHAVTTSTHIDLLDGTLGHVPLAVRRFDVVIEQLIAIAVEVGVVEIADLLGRNHLEGGSAGRLPADTIDVGGEITLLHAVTDPIAHVGRVDIVFPGMSDRIIQLIGLVFRIGTLGVMDPHLDLDIGHIADVVGVGVDGKRVVHIHLGPAFSLGGVGTTRIVRITLRPPD